MSSPGQYNDDYGYTMGSPQEYPPPNPPGDPYENFQEMGDENFQYNDDYGYDMVSPSADPPADPSGYPFEEYQENGEQNFGSSISPEQYNGEYGYTMGSSSVDPHGGQFEEYYENQGENYGSSADPHGNQFQEYHGNQEETNYGSSANQYNDDFGYTMGSTQADLHGNQYDNFQQNREEHFASSTPGGEDNGMAFDELFDSLDLPPDATDFQQQQRTYGTEGQEQVRNHYEMGAEMYVGQEDMPQIQQEKEAILKFGRPSHSLGMPLKECPFILKLYLAANSYAFSMIRWSPNGHQLLVDYEALQHHLTASSQIFCCRNVLQFTEMLMAEGFVRLHKEEMYSAGLETADVEPMWVYYQQEEFVRGDLESLKKLIEKSFHEEKYNPKKSAAEKSKKPEPDPEFPEFSVPLHMPSKSHIERMRQRGDKCCASISLRGPMQSARCRLRTLLDHLATAKILLASAHLNENNSMKKGRPWDFPTFTSSSIQFVRPHDSVITLDPNKPLPEYAGYYGQLSPSKVTKFFSDYLPRYGNKTTGYKDIVLETTNKPSNFQQNLPIGVEYSDSDDNEPDDVQPPVSPAGQDSDMDFMPSTSAAAAAAMRSSGRKGSVESVDDQDLEEAMQELCGGSTALKENAPSGGRGKAKAQPQPKSPKATSRKRRAKSFDSTTSEDEAEVSQKPKRVRKETIKDTRKVLDSSPEEVIEDEQEVLPKKRGPKAKAKTPKATARKRIASPTKDEASPPRKRAKKGVQDSRKTTKRKHLQEELDLEEEEVPAKKKRGQKKKQQPETDEETEEEDFQENREEYFQGNEDGNFQENREEYFQGNEDEYVQENEHALQDEHENVEEDEYLQEEIPEEDVYQDDEIVGRDEYLEEDMAEGDEQPKEGQHFQEEFGEDEYYPEENPEEYEEEHPEEFQEEHPEEFQEDHPEEESEEEHHEEEEYPEEDEQPEEDINADQNQENEVDEEVDEDENAEEEEDVEEEEQDETDEEDDVEDNDDDDDDDYSVQYRAAPVQPDRPRRYDLRNSMRKTN